jgi:Ca2+-transporting ATPase
MSSFMTAILTKEKKPDAVLSAVQLIWVNLIMDTFAALALATDPPHPDILERPPSRKSEYLVNFNMWKMLLTQAVYQIIVCTGLYLHYTGVLRTGVVDWSRDNSLLVRSLVFNTFVLAQVFNEINCRILGKELNIFKGIHKNPIFISIFVGTLIAQFLIIQFLSVAFKCIPLDASQWGLCILLGMGSMPVGALARLFPNSWLVVDEEPTKNAVALAAERHAASTQEKADSVLPLTQSGSDKVSFCPFFVVPVKVTN